MTKDESPARSALKLALEALKLSSVTVDSFGVQRKTQEAITAIREALAEPSEALAERCVCGEPDTPGTHRTDGPCLAEQPAQQWTDETAKVPDHVWDEKCVLGHCGWPSGCADSERCRADNTPAQQQEPVAEVKAKRTGGNVGIATVIHEIHSPMRHPLVPGDLLYACSTNQPPVGWMHSRTGLFYSLSVKPDESGLLDEPTDKALLIYTSPPANANAGKPWVGLTDEEWQDLSDRYGLIIWGPFKREIEAKLMENNA